MIRLEEVVPGIPRPGWPGRRRAIARLVGYLIVAGVVFVGSLVAVSAAIVVIAARMDALPR